MFNLPGSVTGFIDVGHEISQVPRKYRCAKKRLGEPPLDALLSGKHYSAIDKIVNRMGYVA